MIWGTLAPALLAIVKSIALDAAEVPSDPVPSWDPTWVEQRRPYTHPTVQAEVLLQITAVTPSYEGFSYANDGADLKRYIEGMRDFTLSIQVRGYDLREAYWALNYAERISTRLERRSAQNALAAINACVVDKFPIQNLGNLTVDQHAVSVANLDVRMRAAFTDEGEIVDYFDKLELTSNLSTEVAPLDAAAQLNDVQIPPGI